MFGKVLDWIQIAAGAAAGGAAVAAVMWLLMVAVWLPAARREGEAGYIARQAVADTRAELQRKNDDAKLRKMSDYDLCVAGLRSRGLRIDACEQLRGLQPERLDSGGNGRADQGG